MEMRMFRCPNYILALRRTRNVIIVSRTTIKAARNVERRRIITHREVYSDIFKTMLSLCKQVAVLLELKKTHV